jgi:hypothetical protein
MTTKARVVFGSMFVVLGLCLTGAIAFTQSRVLKDTSTMDMLAAKAMQQILNTPYRGNGRPISGSGISAWLTQNRVSLSKLPPDIGAGIRGGTVDGLLIPDVPNPVNPGTRGEVVLVRPNCQVSTTGCERRGFLIQPPGFRGGVGDDELCENCYSCDGPIPPNCDTYSICVCTNGRCPGQKCRKCTGC